MNSHKVKTLHYPLYLRMLSGLLIGTTHALANLMSILITAGSQYGDSKMANTQL